MNNIKYDQRLGATASFKNRTIEEMKGLGKSNRKGDTKGWCLNNLYGENQHKVFFKDTKDNIKKYFQEFLTSC